MSHNQQNDRPNMIVAGFVNEAKSEGANNFVNSVVIRTKDIEKYCDSEYVNIKVFVSKKDPQTRRVIKIEQAANPNTYKDPAQFQNGGGGGSNNTSSSSNGDYTP